MKTGSDSLMFTSSFGAKGLEVCITKQGRLVQTVKLRIKVEKRSDSRRVVLLPGETAQRSLIWVLALLSASTAVHSDGDLTAERGLTSQTPEQP